MNKEIIKIVVKVNSREEYEKLYKIIKIYRDYNNIESIISSYPNYIFINLDNNYINYFSNENEYLNDEYIINFITEEGCSVYGKILTMIDIYEIISLLKYKIYSPSYKPKGKIIRTFEDFNNNF